MNVQWLETQCFAQRNHGEDSIDTIVLHTMHHPEVDDFFNPHLCKSWLEHCGVSTHYILDRKGDIWQMVPETKMAWHAGQSKMPFTDDQRQTVNEFSLGIEILATQISGITESQYRSLLRLCAKLVSSHGITAIVGHCDIAPGRKTDPWLFDWVRFKSKAQQDKVFKSVRFSPAADEFR